MIQKDLKAKEGMRIKLLSMVDDPNPIPKDTTGTIRLVDDAGTIHVDWDNGRRLGLLPGVDSYVLEPKEIPTSDELFNAAEENQDYMTGAGGAGGPTSSGPFVGKLESTFSRFNLIKEITNSSDTGSYDDTRFEAWADKNRDGWKWNDKPAYHEEGEIIDPLAKIKTTWDDSNLDISKEWDKTQLKKEDVLKIIKNRINEVKKGVTIDLEKGDEILTGKFKNRKETVKKIGKNKDKQPTVNDKAMLKFKIPKLTPKKEVKEEESIEETTTFASVWGVNGPPVGPAFAAKKGQWLPAKKPIWKGGKIVQKDTNEGVLNPVNEANDVKWVEGGKYVKVKKKCTKYPYCNQGAIDNPLSISDKITGDASYVENIKKIHEVAKQTGKTFDEVYKVVMKNVNN